MDESGFIIEVAEHDGWMRIAVRGEIDLATKGQMHEALADACTKGTAGVELDLSEVTFIDSSGLLSLIDALTFCRRKDIELQQPNT